MKTSLYDVHAAGLSLQRKAEQAATLYRAYYGKFSPQMSSLLYSRIGEAGTVIKNIKATLQIEGFDADDLGFFPWLFVVAASIGTVAYGIYKGAEAFDDWKDVQIADAALEEKKLDAAIAGGFSEAYLIDNRALIPPGVTTAAAGFGLGAFLALGLVGYLAFSTRGRR
jgi:hypothetical protein